MITFLGAPKSTSHIYKFQCRGKIPMMYMTAEGRKIKETYQLQAKEQWGKKPSDASVELGIKIYFGDKRVRDIDNYGKLLLDSMTDIVYEDDKQIKKMTVEKFIDVDNPRIEVEIYENSII